MNRTLHIVSHTHWDREWYLTFQQFRLKLVHLVDGLLEILDANPDYKHFMLDGQTIVLDDYLCMRPEKEAVLRQHVQNGRILIGPWHLLPDMFLVSPEAHVRNLLQGRRTARRFGPLMPVGYIPDPFGHPGQIPQILRGFGIQTAAVWRGVGDMPCEFWWQSPDGSRVLMAFLRDSYGNGASLAANEPAQFTAQLEQIQASLAPHSACNDVLVMYGTDHMEPVPNTPTAIAYANAHLDGTSVLHSTLPAYLQAISEQLKDTELPMMSGELRQCSRSYLLPGVLSTRMWIKQRNAACETLLEKWVEPFSVFASLAASANSFNSPAEASAPVIAHLEGAPLQASLAQESVSEAVKNLAPLVRQTWRMLMENHPHDSICGCSIDQVAVEMGVRFDQVEQIGEELTRQSLSRLAACVDTRSPGAIEALVVFNPSGAPRRDLLQAELSVPEEISGFDLVAADGSLIPYEMLGSTAGEFANLVVDKKGLREMFGNIHAGRVAGVSIVKIHVGERAPTVSIDAVVAANQPPDLAAFKQAEQALAAYEVDAGVTHFHIRARQTRSSHLRFVTPEIPAQGWGVIWACPRAAEKTAVPGSISPLARRLLPAALRIADSRAGKRIAERMWRGNEHKPPFVIENEIMQVEASPQDGTLTLTDKCNGAVYRGLHRFVDGGDAGDEYNYSPPAQDSLLTPERSLLKVWRSPVAPALEITCSLRVPACLAPDRSRRASEMVDLTITSRVSLSPGVPRLEFHTEIENCAADHRLRVHFPTQLHVAAADFDGHYEVVRRPLGLPEDCAGWVEEPRPETHQRGFTDVSDGQLGLMLANRGLPEVEVLATPNSAEMALTLLRCVGWLSRDDLSTRRGHAGPANPTPGAQMPGRWVFEYAVIPHAEGWQAACHHAYAFAAPLRAVATELHAGSLPQSGAFIAHSPDMFHISAVKQAEIGQGWIVRGYNLSNRPLQVSLCPWHRFTNAVLTNLAEEPLSPLTVEADGSVHFTANAHQVVTVRFW